jgi:hypothetical protein
VEVAEVYSSSQSFALRYWDFPRTDNTNYRDWYPKRSQGTEPEGAQYLNSTIMGHAFYLLTKGGTHNRAGLDSIPTITVPKLDFAKTRDIFYRALIGADLTSTSGFPQLRQATILSAAAVYGSTDAQAVATAWDAVGVPAACPASAPAAPQLIVENTCPTWRIQIPTVPGAITYNIQYSYTPSFTSVSTLGDGEVQGCDIWVSMWIYLRARACNACGCSGWSPTGLAWPFIGECP